MSAQTKTPSFQMSRRVEFHETDMAGLVHFANFFRYMEAAEHTFLRSLGQNIHEGEGEGATGWPRVSATCDYRKPLRFGDVLTIRVFVEEVRTRSVRYGFEMLIEEDGPLIAVGSVTAACVSLVGAGGEIRAVSIPEGLRAALLDAQSKQ